MRDGIYAAGPLTYLLSQANAVLIDYGLSRIHARGNFRAFLYLLTTYLLITLLTYHQVV